MRSLSNLFSIIRLGQTQNCEFVLVDRTKLNLSLIVKLFFLGYIRGYKFEPFHVFKIFIYFHRIKKLITPMSEWKTK